MKDCTTCKYGYEDERLGIPMCHHPRRFSEDCVDFNMHEEKEIKEPEKPIDIDFEQELYKHFGQVKDFTLGMRIGQYFYELGKHSGSSEIPNDLDVNLAANNWICSHKDGEVLYIKPAFIVGAKWQKEQMLKEAVEGRVYDFRRIKEIGYSSAKIEFDKIPELDDGDKVRVIVCKKEEE